MSSSIQKIEQSLIEALAYSRFGLFSIESLPITLSRKLLGTTKPLDPPPPKNHKDILRETIKSLIKEEIANLKKEIYSTELILPEHPVKHLKRYVNILADSLNASLRSKKNQNKVFSAQSKRYQKGLPKYYLRNFHHQTDGYLSSNSAEFYSHQTEILFKGTIALMRRLLLAPLLEEINNHHHQVEVLEMACGAGESTKIIHHSCPHAQIKAIDLSLPYLEHAENEIPNNVVFEQGNAENYSSNNKYDYIFCSYLFHELPEESRLNVIHNAYNLLKPNGTFVIIDSLQMNDQKEFNWALIDFPKNFHEPFYKSYVNTPLENLTTDLFEIKKSKQAFLSKALYLQKKSAT